MISGKMSRILFSLSISRLQHAGRIGRSCSFYPNGGPVILLPAYKSGEAVKPIHQVMVNRQLMDAGISEARALPMIGYARTASKFRPAHKTKSPAKHGAPPKRGRKLNGLA
jgi:hypothetical protein